MATDNTTVTPTENTLTEQDMQNMVSAAKKLDATLKSKGVEGVAEARMAYAKALCAANEGHPALEAGCNALENFSVQEGLPKEVQHAFNKGR